MKLTTILLALFLATGSARADVQFAETLGFSSQTTVEIEAGPDAVFEALVSRVGEWWNPAHSWSGDAANLSIDPVAGGCFCEILAEGGSAVHLTVLLVKPGELLRLGGGLGPLQGLPIAGVQTWRLEGIEGGKTRLTLSYLVSGSVEGGLTTWAGPVDGVHKEQISRLKNFIETGNPLPAP